MIEYLENLNPFILALLAGGFAFLISSIGSSLVFFFNSVNNSTLTIMLGISSGVMIAASFWSLLAPAIDLSVSLSQISWLIPTLGFICGGAFIILSDLIFNRFSVKHTTKRNILLTSSISMHNIPEGLAIGVSFGLLGYNYSVDNLIGAILLSIGIAFQNFPEGACVSLPLRSSGISKTKSFLIGSISGLVEIIGVIIGVMFSLSTNKVLPFVLSFAAGNMIAVSASELIPDAFSKNKVLACLGLIIGFTIMMALDVGLSSL